MTDKEMELFEKIQAFELDDNSASFKFSERLARENGWSKTYTHRVIDEYKKFIFLCCISDSGVTPSDPVDQAWHLHLTFTKSYWIDFCQNTLGQQIHHNPTKGGDNEREKFKNFYETSKTSTKKNLVFSLPTIFGIIQKNVFLKSNFNESTSTETGSSRNQTLKYSPKPYYFLLSPLLSYRPILQKLP